MGNFNNCSDYIFLGFDRKMGKEKRCQIKTSRKLSHCFNIRCNGGKRVKYERYVTNKLKKAGVVGNGIGVGTAIGAFLFVLTREPVWIALGVAIGAALDWERPKGKTDEEER